MKKFLLILLTTTLALAACLGDDGTNYPPDSEQLIGNYEGTMKIGLATGDTTVHVRVNFDQGLSIAPMAMHLMMDSIVSIDPKGTTARELEKIEFFTTYTAQDNKMGLVKIGISSTASDLYVMALPDDPDHIVGADKTPHTVRLTIMPTDNCTYNTIDKRLNINLKITNAKLDGQRAERFKDIPLTINASPVR